MSVREEGERKSEREREREREGKRRPMAPVDLYRRFISTRLGAWKKARERVFYSCGKKCFLGQFSILIWRKLQASATLNLLLY
jgi:hypothetical protein